MENDKYLKTNDKNDDILFNNSIKKILALSKKISIFS